MAIDEFLRRSRIRWLYHFTDVSNLPLIRQHGLLSHGELLRRGIKPPRPGGNKVSRQKDAIRNLGRFVHLCFKEDHPMEYSAREEGRIGPTVFLKISTEVLNLPGVYGCSIVANKSGSLVRPLEEVLNHFDAEVLFKQPLHVVLANHDLKARYNEAKKSEILIPDCIPTPYILNLDSSI